jgi:tryptophan-rich sensory protein
MFLQTILPWVLFFLCVLLCSAGAYFVANTICQRQWKEKIPQAKLIGFAAIFLLTFVALAILLVMASYLVFGR